MRVDLDGLFILFVMVVMFLFATNVFGAELTLPVSVMNSLTIEITNDADVSAFDMHITGLPTCNDVANGVSANGETIVDNYGSNDGTMSGGEGIAIADL